MKFNEPSYYFLNDSIFMLNNVRSVGYGTKTISFLGPEIWNILPTACKENEPKLKFKEKI